MTRPRSAEERSRSAQRGSQRGHRRRQLRERVRRDYLLQLVQHGGPDLMQEEERDRYLALAEWIATFLPDYVIEALESRPASQEDR